MTKKSFFLVTALLSQFGLLIGPSALGAEKMRFGTSVKGSPFYELPAIAAEEQGLWKQNGLEVTWFPFRGGPEVYQAVAANSVDLVVTATPANLQAAARGLAVVIVADSGRDDFFIWVRADNPIKEPRDLKGARVGIVRFGGTAHAYARAVTKALGIEKEVKFTAGGGMREEVAMIRAGQLEARASGFTTMAKAKYDGIVRELLSVQDYLPREWIDQALTSRKEFMAHQPELLRRGVKGYLASTRFIKENQDWSVARIKTIFGFSEEGARGILQAMHYSSDGRVEPRAVENVRAFLVEYNLVSADKVPPARELYTNDFVG